MSARTSSEDVQDFDAATLARRDWLRSLIDSGEADQIGPFALGPGQYVVSPARFARNLLSDLESIYSARARGGIAQKDLEAFHRHVTTSHGSTG